VEGLGGHLSFRGGDIIGDKAIWDAAPGDDGGVSSPVPRTFESVGSPGGCKAWERIGTCGNDDPLVAANGCKSGGWESLELLVVLLLFAKAWSESVSSR
jgi:hypothetical protein